MRGALPAAPGRFCCANRSVDGPSPKYPRAAATPPKKLRRETSWLMDPPEKVDERNYAILTRTAGSGLASFDDGQNCRFSPLAGLVVGLRARRPQKRAQFRAIQVSGRFYLDVAHPGSIASQHALRIGKQRAALKSEVHMAAVHGDVAKGVRDPRTGPVVERD